MTVRFRSSLSNAAREPGCSSSLGGQGGDVELRHGASGGQGAMRQWIDPPADEQLTRPRHNFSVVPGRGRMSIGSWSILPTGVGKVCPTISLALHDGKRGFGTLTKLSS